MSARRIDDHTLEVLEFRQVLEILTYFASSDLGKAAVMSLYPSTDPQWITQRLAQTSQSKDLLLQGVRIPLAGIRDIRPMLTRMGRRQTVLEPNELLQIRQVLQTAAKLRQFLLELDQDRFGQIRSMADGLHEFGGLIQLIQTCIGPDGKVKDTASVKLSAIRGRIAKLKAHIQQRFEQIMADPEVHKALENENIVTRHGRPVLAIKTHYKAAIHGTVLDRSNTGATLYVEPESLVEVNNELEEAVFEEKKEINRILWDLTHQILAVRKDILQTLRSLGQIDLAYAKAQFSIAYGCCCPQIAPQPQARLIDARHPLLLKIAAERHKIDIGKAMEYVVPVSPRIGDDLDLLLITGPNAGGKTVLLKTIGLCILLAQSGCHIPAAAGSQVGIYQQVFADIGDQQSIQENLSTFSAHMKQVIRILANTSPGTLVLLDELGAGTDPQEGAALAAAILDEVLARSGHVIATTHMGQLKAYAFSRPRSENASLLFDAQTLKPTFRLLMGTPGSSNALAIAQRLGMSRRITARAKEMIGADVDQTTTLINQVQKVRQLAEDRRAEAERAVAQARATRQQLELQIEQLRQQEQLLRCQADLAIDQALRQVKHLVDQFCKAMQNAPRPWPQQATDLAAQIDKIIQSSPLAVKHMEFIRSLRRGDSVYMIPFRTIATVDKIHYNRGTIVLLAGGKQIELGLDQICRPEVARYL